MSPSGDPKDFHLKPCLHSIGYAGLERGQAQLTVDEFQVKAKALGFDGVMLMAKRPHLSPLDHGLVPPADRKADHMRSHLAEVPRLDFV